MIAAFVPHECKCSAYNLSHMEFLATDKFLVIQEHKIMDEKNSLQNHSLFSSHFSKEKKGVLIDSMDYSVSSLQLHQCNDCSALAYMYPCIPFQTVQSEDTPWICHPQAICFHWPTWPKESQAHISWHGKSKPSNYQVIAPLCHVLHSFLAVGCRGVIWETTNWNLKPCEILWSTNC